jgi:[ribosomal protein S5]-alanine N-acetyltransferase
MTERSKSLIELPYGALVEATIPILVADEAFVVAAQQCRETMMRMVRKEIPPEGLQQASLQRELEEFGRLLDARTVANWPPAFHDHESRLRMIRFLESDPEPGWGKWYFLVKASGPEGPRGFLTIGIGGFKGPPSNEGTVEIECSIVEPYDAFGRFATAAIGVFVAQAFEDPRVQRVIGEHSPLQLHYEFPPSYIFPSILAFGRNGFVNVGAESEGVIRFQRDRRQPQLRVETPRLTLLEATIPLLMAEGAHVVADAPQSRPFGSEFEQLLDAKAAEPWPPPLNDEDSRQWMIRQLEAHPEPGWGMWYILLKRSPGESAIAVGNGGFKGPPSADGTVEIGYSVVEGYQRLGIGGEAVGAFVERAFANPRVRRVIAETFPDNVSSIRVLEKNGFRRTGAGSEAGSVLFERLPNLTR